MRILIPSHTFLPASPYGAELYAYYLGLELTSLGHSVHVLFTERGLAHPERRMLDGLACTAIPLPSGSGPARVDAASPAATIAFGDLLESFRPDIVHFNHLLHLSPELPERAKRAGVPVVFTLHDFWMRCPRVKLLDRWGQLCTSATRWKCASCARHRYSRMTWTAFADDPVESPIKARAKEAAFGLLERPVAWRRLLARDRELAGVVNHVDRFIAPTTFLAERLREWGIPPAKLLVCDYGTCELPYAPHHADTRAEPVFGFVGGTTREKGVDVLLDAFRGLSGAQLVIYGADDARLREAFPAHHDVLSQPNVRAGGRINDEQKSRLIPALDALIVPSVWYENSPIVIHEAFQAGVPVVCSNIGGMAELVTDDVDGLHFQVGDPASLRATIARCVDDPSLLPRLASKVRTPRSMRDHALLEIVPLYQSVIAAASARSAGTVA